MASGRHGKGPKAPFPDKVIGCGRRFRPRLVSPRRREGKDEFLGGIIGRVVGTFYYPKDHFVERPYTRLSNFVPEVVDRCDLV